MNPAHLHLLVNHLPIIGFLFAIPLAALALLRPGDRGIFTAVALVVALAAGGGVASQLSGEGAEEVVEDLPDVRESLIHEHEEAAEAATVVAVATALLALGLLGWRAKRGGDLPRPALAGMLLATLVAGGAMARVGQLGGVIRHTEIREGAAAQPGAGEARGEAAGEAAGEGEEEGEEEGEDDDR